MPSQMEVALQCTQKLFISVLDWMDWLLLRKLVLLEHFAVLIILLKEHAENSTSALCGSCNGEWELVFKAILSQSVTFTF